MNQRVQQAQGEERDRAAVAQIMVPDESTQSGFGWRGKRGRQGGLIGSIFVATFIIVSVMIVVTRDEPTALAFYAANPQFGISDLEVLLDFVSQDLPAATRLLSVSHRELQDQLTLVFNLAMTYTISQQ